MPGTRDSTSSEDWFEELFGFKERDYKETRSKLEYAGATLTSRVNGRAFPVGHFETPTLEALRYRCDRARAKATEGFWSAGALNFANVVGDTRALHLDPQNAAAVFQVASLFNCLETTQVGRGPEAGVASYASRPLQGPAAAMACPAATVYRNYFINGTGQLNNELDCLGAISRLVENEEEHYWTMVRGYCLPVMPANLARLSAQIAGDSDFEHRVQARLQVGVHWDAEVASGEHQVCQVFCSALPVAEMKQRPVADWVGIAVALLQAAFDATLTAATLLAAERSERVRVFLTVLGGGELGNRRRWIVHALNKALNLHDREPLDVMLVHYSEVPSDFFVLEEGRDQSIALGGSKLGLTAQVEALRRTDTFRAVAEERGENGAAKLSAAFAHIDANGDGVIDRRELTRALQSIDEDFFSTKVVNILFDEADCGGDGVIHYRELANWLWNEDEDIVNSIFSRVECSPLHRKMNGQPEELPDPRAA